MEVDSIQSMGMPTYKVVKFKEVLVYGPNCIPHILIKSTRMNSVVYLNDGTIGIIECVPVMCSV